MNIAVIVGRLVKDIELRYTNNGKAAIEFTVAVNKDKEHTDFLKIKAYGKCAEIIGKYCKKGDNIGIRGTNKHETYTDKEENKKSVYYILAEQVILLGNKNQEKNEYADLHIKTNEAFEMDIEDPDLPF